MCTQHKETKYLQIILLADLTDCTEVTERFTHLVVINVQECIVHPVFGKFFAVACLTLCDLILMMWKYQVFTTGMDVNLLAQIFFRHYRAFDMPSRTSITPRRLPCRLAFFLWFPEYEIQRIFLLVLTAYQQGTITGTQIIQILMR